jgi:hypothetical protein
MKLSTANGLREGSPALVPSAPAAALAMPLDFSTLTDSLTHQQRALLHDLAWLTRRHAGNAADAKVTLDAQVAKLQGEVSQTVGAAQTQHARLTRASENEHKALRKKIAARSDEQIRGLETDAAAAIQSFVSQSNQIESKAKAQLEERTWLADTMLESAVKKSRQDFDSVRQQTESRTKDLIAIQSRAVEILKLGRYAMLPETSASPCPEDSLAWSGSEFTRAVKLLESLGRRAHPFVLNIAFVITTVLASAAAGAIIGSLRAAPVAAETTRAIGVGAAVGTIGAMLIMAVVRFLLRSRVPACAAELALAMANAKDGCERSIAGATSRRDAAVGAARLQRDRDLESARSSAVEAMDQVTKRRKVEEPALRASHADAIREARATRELELETADRAAGQRSETINLERDTAVVAAQSAHERDVAAATAAHAVRAQELFEDWSAGMRRLGAVRAEAAAVAASICTPWSDPAWATLPIRGEVPPAVSIGRYRASLNSMPGGLPQESDLVRAAHQEFPDGVVELPLMLDLHERGSLLLQHTADARASAIAALNNTMMRLMTAFPPSKVRFTIIDPVGLGESFAAFTHLSDLDEQLISDKVWTDPRHIEQRLAELTEHMETVIQKYLRNEFATIQDYNAMAGEVAEPYRFLVLADFPANISEQAAKRLTSILTSGPKCGVFTLIAHDARTKPPAWVPLAEMQKASMWLRYEGGSWVRQDDDFKPWVITLESAPDEATCTSLLRQVGSRSKELGKVRVPFEMVAPPDSSKLWSLSSRDEVHIPLGRAGATKLQYLTLGQGTAQHALIAGRTGSGKSTLLHVIITNLSLWYSPDEIEMYLVDFKKGVEFKAYAAHELPHARVIAVESEREFGLSVLRRLDAELTRRGQLFRDRNVQDVAGWRRSGGGAMPRVMFIVDEFQEFFVEDDKLAQESSLLLDRLVRQGRAFGMHVILGSQTLGGAYSLARSTLGQMAVRIALQCSEADSYLIMSEDNPAPRLLNRPGEAIYNDASGMIEGNSPFQIVWLPEETREARLDEVRKRDAGAPHRQRIIFEGNLPADIVKNHQLAEARQGRHSGPPQAWLGDAVSIKDPTSMVFRRQSACNLLIVGQQEDASHTLMLAAFASLAANPSNHILVLDSTPADAPEYGVLERLALARPDRGFPRFAGPRAAAAAISAIAEEVASRETSETADAPAIFVLIVGVHRFRDLRKSDDFSFSSDDAAPKPDKQLTRILREGPALGVHVIAWCDSAANVDRTFERATAREFEARVLFQMSANDSTNLIDTPAAATLGRNRALLYREELGTVEKFRPYATPAKEWIESL